MVRLQTCFMIYIKQTPIMIVISIYHTAVYIIYINYISVGWDVRLSPMSRITILTVSRSSVEGTL